MDHGAYPVSTTAGESVNGARFANSEWDRLPSFRLTRDGKILKTLTTPNAYITAYPADPFATENGATFVYYAAKKGDRAGWILITPGPMRRYDIDPIRNYDPAVSQPTPHLLNLTYDPTNGAVSRGDIWRAGP
jgi:hypothetical protein